MEIKTLEFDFKWTKGENWRLYDDHLDEVKIYYHLGVPTEIVIHSRDPIIINFDGKWVKPIRNPVTDGRLIAVICRSPKNTRLTFLEAKNILNEIEEVLGEVRRGRSSPSGC